MGLTDPGLQYHRDTTESETQAKMAKAAQEAVRSSRSS